MYKLYAAILILSHFYFNYEVRTLQHIVNLTTHSIKYFVQTDNEKPSISSLPSNIVQDTDESSDTAVVTWVEPTANDNSEGSVTLTSSHSSGDAFPIGETIVTYTATDEAGNQIAETFTVTIEGRSA